ncbi:hypothetical protein KQI84_02630 [bacterium]|nr:hypothetical protein [bacterium]
MMIGGDGGTVWIVSQDNDLVQMIEPLLRPLADSVTEVNPEQLMTERFWSPRPEVPGLVVLDVGSDLDGGLRAIRRIRKARFRMPIVVFTCDFSREFGVKIVSEGVRYYFARDFCQSEFCEVAESLLKNRQSSV